MSNLRDKRVVVTGASGGLGAAVVKHLIDEGAELVLPLYEAETPESLVELADRVTLHHGVDLSSEARVAEIYDGIPELWGSVHLVGGFAMAPIEETSAADLESMWKMNAVSCFLCCREAVRHIHSGGRIVNVSARPALSPVAGMLAYSMSKAAVAALTRGLAAETRDRDITVNAIVPSIIDTPTNRASMPNAPHETWPKPGQIAETVSFLLSDAGALTSGALVPVYGRA